METAIVVLIVGLASLLIAGSFFRAIKGKGNACHCTKRSCMSGGSCSEIPPELRMEDRKR